MNATQFDEYRPFEVHIDSGRESVHVAPAGEVDLSTAGVLRKRIDAQLDGGGCDRLVLDLHDVTFMDSTGVRLVIELARAAERDGWQFSVTRMPAPVHRVFELSGVLGAVPIRDQETV